MDENKKLCLNSGEIIATGLQIKPVKSAKFRVYPQLDSWTRSPTSFADIEHGCFRPCLPTCAPSSNPWRLGFSTGSNHDPSPTDESARLRRMWRSHRRPRSRAMAWPRAEKAKQVGGTGGRERRRGLNKMEKMQQPSCP